MRQDLKAVMAPAESVSRVRLGPLEKLVLECLWRRTEPSSVRDVVTGLNGPWAYTTVMTTLDRLFRKGLAARHAQGRAFIYRARVTRADLDSRALISAVAEIDGSAGARDLALAALVDALHSHDPQALDALDRLVRERKRALRRSAKGPGPR